MLFPGGRFIIATLGVSEDGLYSGKPFPDKPSIYVILSDIFEDMAEEGKITQVYFFPLTNKQIKC